MTRPNLDHLNHLIIPPAEQFARAKARRAIIYPEQGKGWLMRAKAKPEPVKIKPPPVVELPAPSHLLEQTGERIVSETDVDRIRWALNKYNQANAGKYYNRAQIALAICADAFNVSINDVISKARHAPLVYIRQKIIAFVHEFVVDLKGKRSSYPTVGRLFGRDHTTILFACKKYRPLIEEARRHVD